MNPFEKILERLKDAGGCDADCEYDNGWYGAIGEAVSIVQEVAKEYNNGWIPCSERLPEEYEDVEVTVEEVANEVGEKRYYNVRSWLQNGQWVIKKNPYHPTVIAWKYPTEPYQQKGE